MRGRGLMISGSHLNNLHRYLLTLMTREGSVSLEQTMLICHKTLKHVTGSRFCAAVIKVKIGIMMDTHDHHHDDADEDDRRSCPC